MTTSQRQSQRHRTSVFSEYENNSNNSISSKQLELWLQQMAPTSHTSPKFGQDWNLMSTSSRYESDGLTFGARMDTFESASKANILSKANFIIEPSKSTTNKENHYQSFSHPQNFQKMKSSKSYINAMQELQKRAKTLEQDNNNMRKSLQILQEEKRNSLQSSMIESEQMRSKLLKFEETDRRIEEMKKENKKLRDSKNQQSLKVKLMQKSINDQKIKVKAFEQRLEHLSKQNEDLKKLLIESNNLTKSLMVQNKQLAQKSETLENMKEKSTNSILEKYAKALQKIQELELNVGQLKNKGNLMEEKHKKSIEEKDEKYWSSLQTINGLKLQKQQLSMKLLNSNNQLEEKSKVIFQLQEGLRSLEHQFSEQNKQIFNLRNILSLKDEKFSKITEKYTKMQNRYAQIKQKLREEQQKQIDQLKFAKQSSPKVQHKQSESESESEKQVNEQNLMQVQQQNDTKSSYFVHDKNEDEYRQSDTPVERYDHTSPGNENSELEEFTTSAKPLSIIVNAKNSQAKIKSEEDQLSVEKMHEKFDESEEEQDSIKNQRYISLKRQEKLSVKENISQTRKQPNRKSIQKKETSEKKKHQNEQISTSQDKKRQQPKSKDSIKSSQSRKQSLQESKYMIPSSKTKQSKKNSIVIANNSSLFSHNRSKSSSVEKKKTIQKKSSSVDSKRSSMIKSKEPCQSRYLNEKPQQVHMYMSAQPTRYPSQHPEQYYYTNEINSRQNYDDHQMSFYQPAYKQNISSHHHSMIGKSESEVKKALNKAMLLEYQEQALKLYEEHEKLLAMSEDQTVSTQEKAEILGRIRQVMNMIDHNTDKIFNLKARSE